MIEVSSDPQTVSIERPALYVVATPIGNLADISARAVQVLNQADLWLVEDTRVARRLMQRYAINAVTRSLHDHNERESVPRLIRQLRDDRLAVALLSDAGTPLIADPGYRLVRAAHEDNIPVRTVPGACAAVAALSIAGLPTDRFAFEGFLPARSGARCHQLRGLVGESRTLVFYEAPHRILASIEDLVAEFGGDREAVVARELTKLHESVYRGSLAEVAAAMAGDPNATRGEFVIVVAGAERVAGEVDERRALDIIAVLDGYLSRADAIKAAAEISGVARNKLYRLSHSGKPG